MHSLFWTVHFRMALYVMAMAIMNRITISWIFLIVISMFFPASAIMYASGATDDNSTSTDNVGSSTTGGGITDNGGSNSTWQWNYNG